MEFDKEIFEEAIKENKIIRYKGHFEDVVKSYCNLVQDGGLSPVSMGLFEFFNYEETKE